MMLKSLLLPIPLFIIQLAVFGQFGPQILVDSVATGITEIEIGDLNNDSLIDIVVSQKYTQNNKITYYLNQGNAQFSNQMQAATGITYPLSLEIADLNNDGWKDIISASDNIGLFYLQNNSGNGFSPIQVIDSTALSVTEVETADLNNDGEIDILSAADTQLRVHFNDGLANFTNVLIPQDTITEYYTVELQDVNNDNEIDIIAGGISALIYINNSGSFSLDIPRSNSAHSQSLVFLLHARDFDSDGDIDLIVDGHSNNDIRCYINDGNGFYSLNQIIDTIQQCQSVASADFDLDGDLDLLAPHNQMGEITWYENLGNGNFSQSNLIEQGAIAHTNRVNTADIDNNGKPDPMWAHSLSFHLNDSNIGIPEKEEIEFYIYPNPASNQITVVSHQETTVSIYNQLGKIVRKFRTNNKQTQLTLNLETGVYYLIPESDQSVQVQKLVVK